MPTAPGHYTIAEVEATKKLVDPPSGPLTPSWAATPTLSPSQPPTLNLQFNSIQ